MAMHNGCAWPLQFLCICAVFSGGLLLCAFLLAFLQSGALVVLYFTGLQGGTYLERWATSPTWRSHWQCGDTLCTARRARAHHRN